LILCNVTKGAGIFSAPFLLLGVYVLLRAFRLYISALSVLSLRSLRLKAFFDPPAYYGVGARPKPGSFWD
jgi:hypothetical protein